MKETVAPARAACYQSVTEQPGQAASRDQLNMMAARYAWARSFASGADVLEVACGAGTGLGMLAEVARTVEAGDIDAVNLTAAEHTYAGVRNVHVRAMDAMDLPYRDESFDLVLLFEALYYLPGARRFLDEARRVLRPGGRLLIVTVNCQWTGFNPSPFSVEYFNAERLAGLLKLNGFCMEMNVGFAEARSLAASTVNVLRRAAVGLHLVPRTMEGKALLKRVFYGKLQPIPPTLEARTLPGSVLTKVTAGTDLRRYRVLYAVATKRAG